MAGVGRTPLPIFVGFFIGLFYVAYVQFKNPSLSDFHKITDNISNYALNNQDRDFYKHHILIWLENEKKPVKNFYRSTFKIFEDDKLLNKKITLWFDSNDEIRQISVNGLVIVKYDWFLSWNLIWVVVALAFHLGAYYEVKKKTINIKTYWNMWEYAFGARKPVMKHNRRIYDPNDALDNSWFDDLFVSKDEREMKSKDLYSSWKRFFKLCEIRSLTPEVKEWMNQSSKGVEFLEGFSVYYNVMQSSTDIERILKTTEKAFDFLSQHMDVDREYYEELGKPFKEKFTTEYNNFINEMDKLR